MVNAYIAIASIAVTLWIPILLKFYRAWLGRHNPVSLAICAVIILLVWTLVAGTWVVTRSLDTDVVILTSSLMSMIVALFTHGAFRWSDRRFTTARGKK